MSNMQLFQGKCKSFDCNKGYGWIAPNDKSGDLFVHYKDINSNSNFKFLVPSQRVQYQVSFGKNNKRKAINVVVINSNTSNNNNSANNYNNHQSNHYMQTPMNQTPNNQIPRNQTPNIPQYDQYQMNRTCINNNDNKQINLQKQDINELKHESQDLDDCKVETVYKWQYQDDFGAWHDFEDSINQKILSAQQQHIYYRIGQFHYQFGINRYNNNKAKQINTTTKTVRNCRRISSLFAVHCGLSLEKMLNVESWDNQYPSWWFDKNAKLHDANSIDWPLDNEICAEIQAMFNKSSNDLPFPYDIEAIYSIQNKYLWKHYQFQRELHSEALGKTKLNEKFLFHGTEYDATQKITVQGFLRDHGRIMAYGKGTYFAKNASMSIDYASQHDDGYQYMFLCAVILGESCEGSRRYSVPPSKPNSSVHYESMVDDLKNPKIFVISKDYQAYPLFLIKFKQQNISITTTTTTRKNKSLIPIKSSCNQQQVQVNQTKPSYQANPIKHIQPIHSQQVLQTIPLQQNIPFTQRISFAPPPPPLSIIQKLIHQQQAMQLNSYSISNQQQQKQSQLQIPSQLILPPQQSQSQSQSSAMPLPINLLAVPTMPNSSCCVTTLPSSPLLSSVPTVFTVPTVPTASQIGILPTSFSGLASNYVSNQGMQSMQHQSTNNNNNNNNNNRVQTVTMSIPNININTNTRTRQTNAVTNNHNNNSNNNVVSSQLSQIAISDPMFNNNNNNNNNMNGSNVSNISNGNGFNLSPITEHSGPNPFRYPVQSPPLLHSSPYSSSIAANVGSPIPGSPMPLLFLDYNS